MLYVEHRPGLPLASFVEAFWYCEGYQPAHRRERVLPGGTFQIVIELSKGYTRQWDQRGAAQGQIASPALVVGMQSRYSIIDTADLQSMIGVMFRPGGARAFLDAPADEFCNHEIPLDLIWRNSTVRSLRSGLQEASGAQEKFAILEAVLQQNRTGTLSSSGIIRYALAEFQNTMNARRVLDVTREIGVSRRRFAQVFREQVGVTPKLYSRICRFRQVLRQIGSGAEIRWADVAMDCGYSDQAHFTNEFREFSGITPGAFLASEHPWLNHVPLD